MMIGDVLGRLHIQDVADGAFDHLLSDGRVERRVTQHVADRHFTIAVPRRPHQLPHLLLVDRERLFEEQVIARFQQRQRRGHVLVIHGAVDGEVRELRHAASSSAVSKHRSGRRSNICVISSRRSGEGSATPTISSSSGWLLA